MRHVEEYSWVSPWLLDKTVDPQQLVPLGDPQKPRIVVGHNVAANLAAEDTKVVTERLAKRLAEFEMSTKAELGTLRQKLQAFFEHRYKYDVRNNWEAVIAPREDGSGNVSSIAFPRTIIWTDYMLLVDRHPDKFTHLPMSARAFGSCRVSLPKAFRTRFSRKSTFCTM